MTRVAAVDCGTNSLRLLVADVDGPVKTDVHREMRVVRLGQGVDRTGVLAPEALARVRVALEEYAATCGALGVEALRLVATSATRDARNREDFVALVEGVLGVPPEVVSGQEEAALSFDGATRELDAAGDPHLVIDIGGGSTEYVLGTVAGGVEAAVSVDVGCVRLTERHLTDDPPTPAQVQAARADVRRALERVCEAVPVARTRTAVGLAGSVTTVAAVALGLSSYDASRTHLARLSADEACGVAERLLGMSRRERAALGPVHPGRVDVLGGGAVVLQTTLDVLRLDHVLVSEADILDGIAWTTATPAARALQVAAAPTDAGTTTDAGTGAT